jgi:hypothetical protein
VFGDDLPRVIAPAVLSNTEVQWEHEGISRILGTLELTGIDGGRRLLAVS